MCAAHRARLDFPRVYDGVCTASTRRAAEPADTRIRVWCALDVVRTRSRRHVLMRRMSCVIAMTRCHLHHRPAGAVLSCSALVPCGRACGERSRYHTRGLHRRRLCANHRPGNSGTQRLLPRVLGQPSPMPARCALLVWEQDPGRLTASLCLASSHAPFRRHWDAPAQGRRCGFLQGFVPNSDSAICNGCLACLARDREDCISV